MTDLLSQIISNRGKWFSDIWWKHVWSKKDESHYFTTTNGVTQHSCILSSVVNITVIIRQHPDALTLLVCHQNGNWLVKNPSLIGNLWLTLLQWHRATVHPLFITVTRHTTANTFCCTYCWTLWRWIAHLPLTIRSHYVQLFQLRTMFSVKAQRYDAQTLAPLHPPALLLSSQMSARQCHLQHLSQPPNNNDI